MLAKELCRLLYISTPLHIYPNYLYKILSIKEYYPETPFLLHVQASALSRSLPVLMRSHVGDDIQAAMTQNERCSDLDQVCATSELSPR